MEQDSDQVMDQPDGHMVIAKEGLKDKKNASEKERRHPVWMVFTLKPDGYHYSCHSCGKDKKGANTSNALIHLEKCAPDLYAEIVQLAAEQKAKKNEDKPQHRARQYSGKKRGENKISYENR